MCTSKIFTAALIVSSLTLFPAAQAQNGTCTTLEQALRLSVLNSPEVDTAKADRDRARADLTDARSAFRPQVSAFARTQAGDRGLTSSGTENTVGLRASQRLFDFGASRLDQDAATHRLASQSQSILSAQTRAALGTAEAYIGLLEIQARLVITGEREAFFNRQFTATEAALEVGGATRAELAEIGARLADAGADRMELQFERDRFATALSVDIGYPVAPCERLAPAQHADDQSIVDAVNRTLARNSELRALTERVDAQSARATRAERNRLPAIDAVAIVSYAQDNGVSRWDYRDRIGVDVSVPLLSGNALNAERRRAQADLQRLRSERSTFRRDLTETVEVTMRRLLSLDAQLVRRKQVAEQQSIQFDAAQREFEAGVRTLPELVEDRLDLEAAELAATTLEFDVWREQISLLALQGDLVSLKDTDALSVYN